MVMVRTAESWWFFGKRIMIVGFLAREECFFYILQGDCHHNFVVHCRAIEMDEKRTKTITDRPTDLDGCARDQQK